MTVELLPVLDPDTRLLIVDAGAILSGPQAERVRISGVAERLRAYLAVHPELPSFCTLPGKDTYARRLIHRDPGDRFIIVAMTWGPGQGTPIHDHGTWGVVGMLRNRIEAWVYKDRLRTRDEGPAEIKEAGRVEAEEGTLLPIVYPPEEEIHRLQNRWDQLSVGIHIYGKDITRCRRVNPRTGRWEWYDLAYTP